MNGSTEKRLFQYALSYKKTIIIGLLCLLVAVSLELAGPFIAKRIIDEHITGIESIWYQVEQGTDTSRLVEYNNAWYIRADRLDDEETTIIDTSTILQIGRDYYWVNEEIPLQGNRSVDNGIITVESPNETLTIESDKLSINELYSFFKPEQQPIVYLLILYVALLLIAAIFQFGKTFLLQKASNRIVQKMRNDVFNHTQKVPINYFVDRPAGKIVARITNDTEAIRDLYERVLSVFVTSIIYMFGIFVALFILDAKLAAFCLLLIPIMYGWMKFYKYFGTKYNKVIRSTVSEINGNINESIRGMSIIQAFQKENQVEKEFEALNQRHFLYQKKLVRLSALTSHNLVNVLRNLAFVTLIWYFGSSSLGVESIISAGVLYAFVDYLTRLFGPVNDVVNQLPLLEQARVASSRVFELIDHDGEEINNKPVPKFKGHIVFDHVWFAYDQDEYVLKDIQLDVQPGKTVAFVGHTGSGKSSIMNLLFRFYDPQKGKIMIDGIDTKSMSRQQVRSHMGIVLQDPFLFTGTILSNVTMNHREISREMAIRALESVGANRFIAKLPNGYDEPVKEGGSTLSMGERQLISFARALAFDPAILILDEAMANIDTETEAVIQRALEVIKQGRTTLVIAHRLSTIQQADHIYVLDHGIMKEQGNHLELLEQQGIYYQMYQMQQGKLREPAI
ncbi:ABC transporter ATP-binding protein/permease [Aquibacillus koreensis]|uniref:ABC transporter ATP-binding protein/permease n=1 Tax=Aquibacillus koreensis TaxID=279446 RepID=A0A9X4AJA1_9BACI|nr:ABC transporter ATP-binding protein [Aquibacillus koreensis]MCT2535779.1 ABC transporter ATP-binding protein/permease [Aquibacillus koreensis]MDC3420235.1 ABC transporter ATP-binding protein/permease [Aquibacillus koreensis]